MLLISLCESYAERYHITFNPIKSKLICYNIDPCTLCPICLNKQPISIVDNDKHLGNVNVPIYRLRVFCTVVFNFISFGLDCLTLQRRRRELNKKKISLSYF